jgi:hypothetical protein
MRDKTLGRKTTVKLLLDLLLIPCMNRSEIQVYAHTVLRHNITLNQDPFHWSVLEGYFLKLCWHLRGSGPDHECMNREESITGNSDAQMPEAIVHRPLGAQL